MIFKIPTYIFLQVIIFVCLKYRYLSERTNGTKFNITTAAPEPQPPLSQMN